jgi:predicted RecB family nuclease
MLLTDQLLLNFQRCHRQAFLEAYGDPNARGQVNDFLLKLGQDKQRFQEELLSDRTVVQPHYPRHDWEYPRPSDSSDWGFCFGGLALCPGGYQAE